MSELAILVPVLRRPHRVAPLLESVLTATPKARVLFIADPDDTAEIEAIQRVGGELVTFSGGYAAKINHGVAITDEPLIFLGADDLDFKPGWFKIASRYLTDRVQVVGVNDLCSERVQAGKHATHFLMTREYAQGPTVDGKRGPLCERYSHSYVDDELVAVATRRGAIAFATDAVVQHLHPDNGLAPMDDTYRAGRAAMRTDRRLFRMRRRLWLR